MGTVSRVSVPGLVLYSLPVSFASRSVSVHAHTLRTLCTLSVFILSTPSCSTMYIIRARSPRILGEPTCILLFLFFALVRFRLSTSDQLRALARSDPRTLTCHRCREHGWNVLRPHCEFRSYCSTERRVRGAHGRLVCAPPEELADNHFRAGANVVPIIQDVRFSR